jgi:hypothetical protein
VKTFLKNVSWDILLEHPPNRVFIIAGRVAVQLRVQPRRGKYLATASEKDVLFRV